MIPDSRRATWISKDFPDDSDSDVPVRRYLHDSWKRRAKKKSYQHQEFSRFQKKGLTKLQSYVAAYDKYVIDGGPPSPRLVA